VNVARFSYSLEGVRIERKALGDGGTINVALPFPPSVNTLFEDVPGGGRKQTKRYRDWRDAARQQLLRQRPRLAVGPVEVTITLEERPGRHEADNLIKAVLDMLVETGIIAGDHAGILRRITAQWGTTEGARVEITRLPTAQKHTGTQL
jgi:Holliday junction resolvase RusA-like endonuclease